MRVKTSLRWREWIAYNYNLSVAQLIYRSIRKTDEELAMRLHDSSSFIYFTFFLLQLSKNITSKEDIFVEEAAHLLFFISLSDATTSLVQGHLDDSEQKIGKTDFYIEEIEVLSRKEFSEKVLFRTLSFIVVRILEKKDGTLRTVELIPLDERFNELLNNNLKKKYEGLHGKTVVISYSQ